jgi:hypothetical protein
MFPGPLCRTAAALLFLLFPATAFSQHAPASASLDSYVRFLRHGHVRPVDYILSQFERSDVVILCERYHDEYTQYETILQLVGDERFIGQVGHIFTEIGTRSNNQALHDLMSGSLRDHEEIERQVLVIYRNLSYYPLWERYPAYHFLRRLALLNSRLYGNRRIELHFCDLPFSWDGMTPQKYREFLGTLGGRDSSMARYIIRTVDGIRTSDQERKKVLVIMNYRHAFNDYRYRDGRDRDNVGRYLFEAYPGEVANVLIHTVAILPGSSAQGENVALIQDGQWDAAFELAGNPEVGFDLAGTPFGQDECDMYPFRPPRPRYQDVFTGYVFHRPIEEHRRMVGIPGICQDGFGPPLMERYRMAGFEVMKGYERQYSRDRERILVIPYPREDELRTEKARWLHTSE